MIHFEELWEKCENLHKDGIDKQTILTIMDELAMKINLYKIVDSKQEVSIEDRKKIKSRTMGEILLTLTNLSLLDNINVYNALNIAHQYRAAEMTIQIPDELKLP